MRMAIPTPLSLAVPTAVPTATIATTASSAAPTAIPRPAGTEPRRERIRPGRPVALEVRQHVGDRQTRTRDDGRRERIANDAGQAARRAKPGIDGQERHAQSKRAATTRRRP